MPNAFKVAAVLALAGALACYAYMRRMSADSDLPGYQDILRDVRSAVRLSR